MEPEAVVTPKTTAGVLTNAARVLATAKLGLKLVKSGDPNERLAGIHDVVVFGRAVTNVLQNLRSTDPGFDEWYAPLQEEMRADPLMRYFYELRSSILKEGVAKTQVRMKLERFSSRDIARFGAPPPGATRFFMGDALGGVGWEVPQPDGTMEKYYVALPTDIGTIEIYLAGAPDTHLGAAVPDAEVGRLAELYLGYLQRLLDKAVARFSPAATRRRSS